MQIQPRGQVLERFYECTYTRENVRIRGGGREEELRERAVRSRYRDGTGEYGSVARNQNGGEGSHPNVTLNCLLRRQTRQTPSTAKMLLGSYIGN